MNLPEFLTEHAPDDIRLTGHRIGLEHVVELHRDGYSAAMIHEEFPTLDLALIERVLRFYYESQRDVDAYVDACHAEIARQRAMVQASLRPDELQRRMEKRAQSGKL